MIYHCGDGHYHPPLSNALIYLLSTSTGTPHRRIYYIMQILEVFRIAVLSTNLKRVEKIMPYLETTFVNLTLSEKQKKDFVRWATENGDDIDMHLTHLILGGHKLSLSYSEKNQSFSCAITCRDKGNSNNGKCVVSQHKSPYDVLWVALYKHVVVLGDTDWSEIAGEDNWG